MPIDINKIDKFIELLGPDGAIAGLERSDVSIAELSSLATRYGVSTARGSGRREIIVGLVNGRSSRINKTQDELMAMMQEGLVTYFCKIVEWLGPDGAIAGLERSAISIAELSDLAARYGGTATRGARRREIIVDLVNGRKVRIDKTRDELMAMTQEDLRTYFCKREVSRTELFRLLDEFGLRPRAEARKNIVDFAAREISDLGMFQRVAGGRKSA